MKRLIALAFVAACAAICLSIAAPSARAAAVVPACTQWGGYPWVNGGCLNGQDINNAFSFNPSALPPQNLFGQGALYGKLWLDISTTPATLRECLISPNCSASYISSQWAVWGTLSSSGWTPVGGGGGTPGGTSGQVQYNNNGLFAGATVGTGLNLSGGVLSATIAAADPTATAGPNAVNGTATTFMRSDAAPAVQKGSNAQFGIVEGDGTTISCVAGVCSAISGGAGITQLTGPVTAGPGTGSVPTTITPTGVTAGTYTSPTVTFNAAGQATAAASGNVTPGSGISVPGGETNSQSAVGVNMGTAGTEYTIANITGGPGYISKIWFTGVGSIYSAVIKVYIDGEGSPSIDTEFAPFGGCNVTAAGRWWTEHTSVETKTGGAQQTYTLKFPLPFHTSARVTITPADTTLTSMAYRTEYVTGLPNAIPWKVKSNWLGSTSYTATQLGDGTVQFLNLASGSGAVIFDGFCGTSATAGNYTYLETAPVAYLDGAAVCGSPPCASPTPQYNTSGIEDFFDSAFYYQGGVVSTPWSTLTEKGSVNTSSTSTQKDMLFDGALRFNNGILFRLEIPFGKTTGVITAGASIENLVLYIVPN